MQSLCLNGIWIIMFWIEHVNASHAYFINDELNGNKDSYFDPKVHSYKECTHTHQGVFPIQTHLKIIMGNDFGQIFSNVLNPCLGEDCPTATQNSTLNLSLQSLFEKIRMLWQFILALFVSKALFWFQKEHYITTVRNKIYCIRAFKHVRSCLFEFLKS